FCVRARPRRHLPGHHPARALFQSRRLCGIPLRQEEQRAETPLSGDRSHGLRLFRFQRLGLAGNRGAADAADILSAIEPAGSGEQEARACSHSIPTARAARMATTASEISAWSIERTFAHRESTGVSVGEKAVLVLKAMKR